MSEQQEVIKVRRIGRSNLREYVEVAMWGFPLFLFMITFVGQNFKIPTQSMENTLLIGDHITVNKFIYSASASPLERKLMPLREPKRGDVVVFKYPGRPEQIWIKRLVGMPGDHVEMINDHLVVNGEFLDEEYAFYKSADDWVASRRMADDKFRPADYKRLKPGLNGAELRRGEYLNMRDLIINTQKSLRRYYRMEPRKHARVIRRMRAAQEACIPEGFYLVMGDNRNRSMDSRVWGLVPREMVKGRAYWVWWSYGEDQGTHEREGWELVKTYLRYPVTFWTRTHWDKTFQRIK